jgi:hypothetical protein
MIDQTKKMIQQNPGSVGGRGMLNRGMEFVGSSLSPGQATPASDLQSQLLQLQSAYRKLPTMASNRFRADASKIDENIKGLGLATSDTQALNSLQVLRDTLASGLERRGAEVPTPQTDTGLVFEGYKFPNQEALNKYKKAKGG